MGSLRSGASYPRKEIGGRDKGGWGFGGESCSEKRDVWMR